MVRANARSEKRMGSLSAKNNAAKAKTDVRSCLSTGTDRRDDKAPGPKTVSLKPYYNKRQSETLATSAARSGNTGSAAVGCGRTSAPAVRIQSGTPERDGHGSQPAGTPTSAQKRAKFRRTERQTELLASLRRSWTTRGPDAIELFPGCKRYLPGARFENFKVQLNPRRPMIDAITLTLLFFGSNETILELFTGDCFGLKHAFGSDMVNDILGYINRYHPGVATKNVPPIKEEELIQAFSRKVYYLRKSRPVDGDIQN